MTEEIQGIITEAANTKTKAGNRTRLIVINDQRITGWGDLTKDMKDAFQKNLRVSIRYDPKGIFKDEVPGSFKIIAPAVHDVFINKDKKPDKPAKPEGQLKIKEEKEVKDEPKQPAKKKTEEKKREPFKPASDITRIDDIIGGCTIVMSKCFDAVASPSVINREPESEADFSLVQSMFKHAMGKINVAGIIELAKTKAKEEEDREK